jgi:hypothetical protein
MKITQPKCDVILNALLLKLLSKGKSGRRGVVPGDAR